MQELNSEPVIPEGFPDWKDTMDSWGYKMIAAIEVIHQCGSVNLQDSLCIISKVIV